MIITILLLSRYKEESFGKSENSLVNSIKLLLDKFKLLNLGSLVSSNGKTEILFEANDISVKDGGKVPQLDILFCSTSNYILYLIVYIYTFSNEQHVSRLGNSFNWFEFKLRILSFGNASSCVNSVIQFTERSSVFNYKYEENKIHLL